MKYVRSNPSWTAPFFRSVELPIVKNVNNFYIRAVNERLTVRAKKMIIAIGRT
jgi:hypothetical protein